MGHEYRQNRVIYISILKFKGLNEPFVSENPVNYLHL